MNTVPQKYSVSVREWHKMGKYNIFPPEVRIELIEGEMIEMAPIGPTHACCVFNLIEILSTQKGKAAQINVQNPIQLNDLSEPEPDLVLLRPNPQLYQNGHPTAADILLLIEVSDSTIKYDRDTKIPLYAKDGIVESWIVDLSAKQVEVYLSPTTQGYTEKRIFQPGESLIPSQLPHIKIDVSDIL
ncbi:MAG: Uma2 family endonuclease [Candidatus Parabeggiatoa sp.]|nr:Uma2 family endonuclease [Candidatus Parabeggiatoa sp.]